MREELGTSSNTIKYENNEDDYNITMTIKRKR